MSKTGQIVAGIVATVGTFNAVAAGELETASQFAEAGAAMTTTTEVESPSSEPTTCGE